MLEYGIKAFDGWAANHHILAWLVIALAYIGIIRGFCYSCPRRH